MNFLRLIIVIGIIVTGIIVIIVYGGGFPYQGEHTGYITAVERGGMFNISTVYVKTDNQSSQEDSYCLVSELVDEAKTISKNRQLVTVKFRRSWVMPIWECNKEAEVVAIEIKTY